MEKRNVFEEVDNLFEMGMRSNYSMVSTGCWTPPTDIYETPNEILVCMELGGVQKNDIKIRYKDNWLTITGHRKKVAPEFMSIFHRMEIESGHFHRRIHINAVVLEDRVEAEYKTGILKIKLPKGTNNG